MDWDNLSICFFRVGRTGGRIDDYFTFLLGSVDTCNVSSSHIIAPVTSELPACGSYTAVILDCALLVQTPLTTCWKQDGSFYLTAKGSVGPIVNSKVAIYNVVMVLLEVPFDRY